MLDVDAKRRPTALQLCKHPWFSHIDSLPTVRLAAAPDYNLVRVCFAFIRKISERCLIVCSRLQQNLNATFSAINANANKLPALGSIGDSNLFKRRNERAVNQQKAATVK